MDTGRIYADRDRAGCAVSKLLSNSSNEETTLEWESFNPALGTLRGTFEIIGDSIISFYTSEDGAYSGTETLTQQDEATYYNVGVSFHNGKKMSSWTALLKAKK